MPSVQIGLHKGANLVLSNPICSGAKQVSAVAANLNTDTGALKKKEIKEKKLKRKRKKEDHFRQAIVKSCKFQVN